MNNKEYEELYIKFLKYQMKDLSNKNWFESFITFAKNSETGVKTIEELEDEVSKLKSEIEYYQKKFGEQSTKIYDVNKEKEDLIRCIDLTIDTLDNQKTKLFKLFKKLMENRKFLYLKDFTEKYSKYLPEKRTFDFITLFIEEEKYNPYDDVKKLIFIIKNIIKSIMKMENIWPGYAKVLIYLLDKKRYELANWYAKEAAYYHGGMYWNLRELILYLDEKKENDENRERKKATLEIIKNIFVYVGPTDTYHITVKDFKQYVHLNSLSRLEYKYITGKPSPDIQFIGAMHVPKFGYYNSEIVKKWADINKHNLDKIQLVLLQIDKYKKIYEIIYLLSLNEQKYSKIHKKVVELTEKELGREEIIKILKNKKNRDLYESKRHKRLSDFGFKKFN